MVGDAVSGSAQLLSMTMMKEDWNGSKRDHHHHHSEIVPVRDRE